MSTYPPNTALPTYGVYTQTSDVAADFEGRLLGIIPGESRTVPDLPTYTLNNRVFNVKDYGAKGDGVTDDTAAFNAAITAVTAAGGGTIYVPYGTYVISTGLVIPSGVIMAGVGKLSVLSFTAVSGACLTIGTSLSALNYKNRVSDLAIIMTQIATTGIKLRNTAGAALRDLYIEGPANNYGTRTNIGVDIDGGNISAFFNELDNVLTNHCHIGFRVECTGTTYATTQTFTNCSAFGDVLVGDTTSFGFYFSRSPVSSPQVGNGEGSVIIGGNAEDCGTGVYIEGGGISVLGTRFEANTLDVNLTATSGNNTFSGSSTLLTVTNAGTNNSIERMSDPQIWTPTLSAQTSGTITLGGGASDAKAYVSRKRNVVTVWGRVAVASVSSPVGNLLIGNLPYTAVNDLANASPVTVHATGLAATATTALQGYVSPNTTNMVIEKYAAGTASPLAGDVVASAVITFHCTYVAIA